MNELPTREVAQKIWEMAVDPDAFPDVSEDSIANRYELSAELVYEAYVNGILLTEAEWRDNLDYERFARWLYNFTSPTGVVSWEGLPQVRQDQWMDRIRHGLDDKLGLGEQP